MKDFLPIGSVVLLKESNKRVMIFGRVQKELGEKPKIWDYAGCFYPEGNLNPDASILFDHDQIDIIFFIGFQDVEEFRYKDYLVKRYDEF